MMTKDKFISTWISRMEFSELEDAQLHENLMSKDIDDLISVQMGQVPVKKRMILFRIFSMVFLFVPVLLFHVFHVCRRMWLFIKYGGEIITFDQNEQPTIQHIYQKLKQNEFKRTNT